MGQCRDGQKDSSTYQVPGLASPDKYQDKFNDKYQDKYRVEANLGQEKFRSDDSNGGDKGMFGLEDKNSKQKIQQHLKLKEEINALQQLNLDLAQNFLTELPSSIGVNVPVLGSLRVDLSASVQKVPRRDGPETPFRKL